MTALLSENTTGARLIVILTIFVFLDILTVGLRLWARRIKKKKLALNDWAIIAGLVEDAWTPNAEFESD